jgi:hypothetical protein
VKLEHKHVLRMGQKLPHKTLRYGGGVVGLDGYLFCAPLHAEHVMRLDTLLLSPKLHQSDARTSRYSSAQSFHARMSRNSIAGSVRERVPSMQQRDHVAASFSDETLAPVLSWQKTTEALFNAYLQKQQYFARKKSEGVLMDGDDDEQPLAISTSKVMTVIAAGVHWRKWAAARAREKHGVSASDRVVGNNDTLMKAMLVHEPEVWCYGLTLENSSIPNDISDWLAFFAETEVRSLHCFYFVFLDSSLETFQLK